MSNGSCLCGELNYTFTSALVVQLGTLPLSPLPKASGSTYTTNLLVPSISFTFLSGSSNAKSFSTLHPSGMALTLHFCEKCGTRMFKEGTMDEFKDLLCRLELWMVEITE
ncbi:hypothetical protein BKA65DRAFT_548395 [Rhexocercosporidium sp. MPI-PUGE-AT-0058]|nr:hypothetical protein BKA65DRAFT_548395 [Rhexocercosporidium sp. MPI-PUGE-AT-0058]